tara:strand:+ start:227 stop:646 length:420 start_codon:yes stop_codon:yes gene_type:complete
MTRIYKILPEVDEDFHPAMGFVMFIMSIIMMTSFFNYRSLMQSLVMIYCSYLVLTFKEHIKQYIYKKTSTFKPVLTPYSNRPYVSNNSSHHNDDSDKDLDMKSDSTKNSEESEELDDSNDQWGNNLRKRNSNPFSSDTI